MWQHIKDFFDSENFMPHGHCFLWQADILWTHVVSDLVIFAAYYSIPFALLYFARRRPDMPFRQLFVLFSLFIVLCGTTHLMSVWVLWHPDYGVEGLIKALTAIASIVTAFLCWKLMPQLLQLPSPGQLQKLNAELVASREDIERRVQERTNQLAEANLKLEEAYKLADNANRAKSDFLANMSHEIRTPMNVVTGLAAILSKSSPLTDKQQEYIRTLQLSTESLLSLITDLLDISKIESNSITLDNVRFNLRQLVTEVVNILSVRAQEKGIFLSLEFDPNLSGEVVGDPTRMRQVLLNLVGNAVKFTEVGTVKVSVKEQREGDSKGRYAILSIVDTGIGIPADKQDTLFTKFSQADNTISKKYGGTGLGLVITRNLIGLMGGSITFESKEGAGSTFTVTLPLAAPDDIRHALRPQELRVVANKGGRKANVLLVEDYQPNILVATTVLEELGYGYEVAMNGKEAMEKLFSRPFDLVLMDIRMPVLDGYSTTRQIRERESKLDGKRVPIIGLTAFAMTDDREKCLLAGMDDYISKPFAAEELGRKIGALVA